MNAKWQDAADVRDLPIWQVMAPLRRTLAPACAAAVLHAPPGSGKTTCVPLALLQDPWTAGRRILLLAPRRLAARAAAYRMADLLGQPVGQTVGYRMRLDSRCGPATQVEVVTEGILTRMLQSDPALTGVALVIFDEFHERSLEADLGLALCLEVRGLLNPELRLLVMSATLETAAVANLLGGAPVVRCEGRIYPVETRYRGPRQWENLAARVAASIVDDARREHQSILAFLPGAPEIRQVAQRLQRAGLGPEWIVAPLYGQLDKRRQDAAIAPAPAGRRKIVLASAIAETSLTIEGVRVVVDAGFMRLPRYDVRSGMTRLATLPVSRAAADQRRGRAGRTGPGICVRLWSQAEQDALMPAHPAEIMDADLTALALELLHWGTADPHRLSWLNPPPPAAYQGAQQLLIELGAADAGGRITAHGRAMAGLPLHPRLAHMVLAAREHALGAPACTLAALLSERDPLQSAPGRGDADLRRRLELLDAFGRSESKAPAKHDTLPAVCARIAQLAQRLRRRLGVAATGPRIDAAGRLLAWAYPDRIAQRRVDRAGRFLLANGRGAFLPVREPLAHEDYLVAAELDGDRRNARIFLAAPYDAGALKSQQAARLQWRAHVEWDQTRGMVRAERILRLGAIVVQRENLPDPDPRQVRQAMLEGIRRQGLECLPWTKSLRTWQARVLLLRRLMPEEGRWPEVSEGHLTQDLEVWLGPALEGVRRLSDLGRIDLAGALMGLLPWEMRPVLDELAPTHLTVPSGSRIPIDYGVDPPVLAVRLQEVFGLKETPMLARGRQPITLHLLSPAGRPVQVTQDMAGFWEKSYFEVRKSLRGRYPRHHWPEDPCQAPATARTKPRRRKM
jgi:ATP-dependent helicase HrpB